MVVQKSHLLALAMIAVVAISYLAQRQQNAATADRARGANVASCKREVARDAYEAAGIFYAAGVSKGEAAKRFEASARSIILSFPRPNGLHSRDVEKMAAVEFVEQPDGKYRYRLTDDARKLQSDGCEDNF